VHKSQGLTLDAAIVGCSKAYLPGQIWVAVGRVKSTSGLQVINFHPSLVRKHPTIVYKFDSVPSPEVSAELQCCENIVLDLEVETLWNTEFDENVEVDSSDNSVDIDETEFEIFSPESLVAEHDDDASHDINIDSILNKAQLTYKSTPIEHQISILVDKLHAETSIIDTWIKQQFKKYLK
jgi:hypothetical protein